VKGRYATISAKPPSIHEAVKEQVIAHQPSAALKGFLNL
jgi:hypothetical protein